MSLHQSVLHPRCDLTLQPPGPHCRPQTPGKCWPSWSSGFCLDVESEGWSSNAKQADRTYDPRPCRPSKEGQRAHSSGLSPTVLSNSPDFTLSPYNEVSACSASICAISLHCNRPFGASTSARQGSVKKLIVDDPTMHCPAPAACSFIAIRCVQELPHADAAEQKRKDALVVASPVAQLRTQLQVESDVEAWHSFWDAEAHTVRLVPCILIGFRASGLHAM